ncbi:hypothetical protein EV11_1315 [Prochlorococcus sp. SS52]|nr:hypothetical protein EV04_1036 [Prochlorococcus marinus str. LG]KGG18535.1 hypothetical protein EV08_1782 [Prochlorococcus marinus str. SS2]KGG22808.1 hypothetical protein EV09_1549 [Prochlorococcus marinus str. SS35]KGG35367.1 hypothetical protein EV11_1315 [Prochlorococcus sp. SS52]
MIWPTNAYEGDDTGCRQGDSSPANHACDSKAHDSNPSETSNGISVGTFKGAWI